MDTATQDIKTDAPWYIRVEGHEDRRTVPTGTADNLESALEAAWRLNRFTESPVEVFDCRDAAPRRVATVRCDWADD